MLHAPPLWTDRHATAHALTLARKHRPEQLPQVGIVRLLIELALAHVGEVGGKLLGKALAEGGEAHVGLLLANQVVPQLLVGSLQALPGQGASEEVPVKVEGSAGEKRAGEKRNREGGKPT
jgi:hypothetical protein